MSLCQACNALVRHSASPRVDAPRFFLQAASAASIGCGFSCALTENAKASTTDIRRRCVFEFAVLSFLFPPRADTTKCAPINIVLMIHANKKLMSCVVRLRVIISPWIYRERFRAIASSLTMRAFLIAAPSLTVLSLIGVGGLVAAAGR